MKDHEVAQSGSLQYGAQFRARISLPQEAYESCRLSRASSKEALHYVLISLACKLSWPPLGSRAAWR